MRLDFEGVASFRPQIVKCSAPQFLETDMILGIGSDLANIERIEATLTKFGDRFKNRVFTEIEQKKAESRPRAIAATYAKRWAAKEACSKALG
ncbi:MAG: hypothetical protein RIR95_1498, partial [Pseudomonadota bacterium]